MYVPGKIKKIKVKYMLVIKTPFRGSKKSYKTQTVECLKKYTDFTPNSVFWMYFIIDIFIFEYIA